MMSMENRDELGLSRGDPGPETILAAIMVPDEDPLRGYPRYLNWLP